MPVSRKEALELLHRLGVVGNTFEENEEFLNSLEFKSLVLAETNRHRAYYENKKEYRRKLAKRIETIEYFKERAMHTEKYYDHKIEHISLRTKKLSR